MEAGQWERPEPSLDLALLADEVLLERQSTALSPPLLEPGHPDTFDMSGPSESQ